MPSKHSKNAGDRGHFTYHEKQKTGMIALKQRLGTESQLPFGYCGLSMYPAEDPVVTPSGHIYSRESILEYLLTKSKEIKEQCKAYEEQQEKQKEELEKLSSQKQAEILYAFQESAEGSGSLGKRKLDVSEIADPNHATRKKYIDDTETEIRVAELQKVSPWVPQFTPAAEASKAKEPPKRPASPFSGRPLRAKDLIPINLIRETDDPSANSSVVRYICPVSRKTITNQKVILIKTSNNIMLEQTAKDLAYPSMTCPITSKKFKMDDVLELVQAVSGFSGTGKVEATKHRPTLN